MKTIKGPGIFLAQFLGDKPPFDTLDHLAEWAAGLGYKALQIPCTPRLIDLDMAAESQAYCDDLRGCLDRHGIEVSELSTHLQGQLVAVHRSEEHTSELQSLMRISYAVFFLKKKRNKKKHWITNHE